MATSPTQLSLKRLRDAGFKAGVVEKWNMHAKIRQDFLGFVDIIGVGELGTIAVQSTSYSNVSSHIKKIEDPKLAENLAAVRKAGWTIEVHGWRKVKNRWQCRVVDLS